MSPILPFSSYLVSLVSLSHRWTLVFYLPLSPFRYTFFFFYFLFCFVRTHFVLLLILKVLGFRSISFFRLFTLTYSYFFYFPLLFPLHVDPVLHDAFSPRAPRL